MALLLPSAMRVYMRRRWYLQWQGGMGWRAVKQWAQRNASRVEATVGWHRLLLPITQPPLNQQRDTPVLHDDDKALQDGPPQEGVHRVRHRGRVHGQGEHEHGGADGPVVMVDPPGIAMMGASKGGINGGQK